MPGEGLLPDAYTFAPADFPWLGFRGRVGEAFQTIHAVPGFATRYGETVAAQLLRSPHTLDRELGGNH